MFLLSFLFFSFQNAKVYESREKPSDSIKENTKMLLLSNNFETNTKLIGNGTEESPYLISNMADFLLFSSLVNNGNNFKEKYFLLTHDIDLRNTSWKPIGNFTNFFQGNFNGGNHILKNINISQSSNFSGLFGYLHNSIITNLNIQCNIKSKGQYNGAISGWMTNVTIINVHVNGEIVGLHSTGGFAGYGINITISNSSFLGQIHGSNKIGGFIGYLSKSRISNSFINITIRGNDFIGGVCGSSINDIEISNVNVSCEINGSKYNGGVIGYCEESNKSLALISHTFVIGRIVAKSNIGGIIGQILTNSYVKSSFISIEMIGEQNECFLIGKTNGFQNEYENIFYDIEKYRNNAHLLDNFTHLNGIKISEAFYNINNGFSTKKFRTESNSKMIKKTFNNFTYQITNDKITITGYNGPGGKVVIPESIGNYSVVTIGTSAFYNKKGITSIILPNTVLNIMEDAFRSCINLSELVLPSHLDLIGYRAFYQSYCLTNITMPKTIKQIKNTKKDYPFTGSSISKVIFEEGTTEITSYILYDNKKLKEVILPNSLISIGEKAFAGCSLLPQIIIPENVTVIGLGAFNGCGLIEMILPKKLDLINNSLFMDCVHLSSVILPQNITKIEDRAFYNCQNLQQIDIPDHVISIGNLSFYNCLSLSEIILPNKLEILGYQFIEKCIKIQNITIPKSIQKCTISGSYSSFAYSLIPLIIFEEGITNVFNSFLRYSKVKNVQLPTSLVSIGEYAFESCPLLNEISIPENVSCIGINAFCKSGLISTTLPHKLAVINNNLFFGCTQLASIILPQNITQIGIQAFYNCYNLENIDLPNQITSIGNLAFYNCTKLTELILPNQIESIGYQFLSKCSNIQNITIPKTLKKCNYNGKDQFPFSYSFVSKVIFEEGTTTVIGAIVRGQNTRIKEVILPNTLIKINSNAFEQCSKLTELIIPDNVSNIGQNAFFESGLVTITLPKKLTSIDINLFYNCYQLKTIVFPQNLTDIGNQAFYNCYSLQKINLPDQVKSIGNLVFYNCYNLTELTLPNKVEFIGYSFLSLCKKLKNITIPKNLKGCNQYRSYFLFTDSSISKVTFEEGRSYLNSSILRNAVKVKEVILPNSLVDIDNNAFIGCSSLSEIKIPDNVSTIGESAFTGTCLNTIVLPNKLFKISNNLFGHCLNLESIILSPNVTHIGNQAFYNCFNLKEINLPESIISIGSLAFYNCSCLAGFILPNKIESIGYQFLCKCTKIQNITIPKTLIKCNSYYQNFPFSGSSISKVIFEEGITNVISSIVRGKDTNIKEVILPNSLTTISAYAFEFCSLLTEINIPESVISIEQYAFSASGLTSIIFPNNLSIITANLFKNCFLLKSIILPENATKIEDQAFYNCYNLDKIIISNQITSIGNLVFYNCTNLAELILPNKIEYIGYQFISKCSKLQNITIPKSLKKIYAQSSNSPFVESSISKVIFEEGTTKILDSIFRGKVSSLKEVVLPESILIIGNYSFENCIQLKSINIPQKVTRIDDQAFYNCYSLEKICLPDQLISIGNLAFYNCTNLTEFILPNKIESIGYHFISKCTKLKNITIPNSLNTYNFKPNYFPFTDSCISTVIFEEGTTKILDSFLCQLSTLKEVILPDSLLMIGNNAFGYCLSLTELNIPENVSSIGINAFTRSGLKSITLPNKLAFVNVSLFSYCNQLKTIHLPTNITIIKNCAFLNCISLERIDLPNEITAIGDEAFSSCLSLTELILPNKIEYIGYKIISHCSKIQNITIPKNLQRIHAYSPNYPFSGSLISKIIFEEGTTKIIDSILKGKISTLKEVVLPESLKSIGCNAFESCSSLININIPENVTTIEQYAFASSGLISIKLPNNLTSLSKGLFSGCYNLSSIILPHNISFIGDNAFYNCISLEKIDLPDQITSIGNLVFYNCSKLTGFTLPNKIECIGYQFIGKCSKIKNITIPKNLTRINIYRSYYPFSDSSVSTIIFEEGTTNIIASIAKFAYQINNVILPNSLTQIREYAFESCSLLTNIIIPEKVSFIGQYAFASTGLKSVILPECFLSINNGLFFKCIQLESIIFPQNLTKIGNDAFYNCYKLQKIDLPNQITYIGCNAFYNCSLLSEIILPNKIQSIGYRFISKCNKIHNITIPKSHKICDNSGSTSIFSGSSVSKIIFEEGTTKVAASIARGRDTKIKEVVLPNSLISIGECAFESCLLLTEINIPDNVSIIENNAFSASGLTSMILPSNLTSIKNSLFNGCSNLSSISIPQNISFIGDQAFYNCIQLEVINLPDQLTSIGNSAFYNCMKLNEVILPDKLESIGYQFIGKCPKINRITVPKSLKKGNTYRSFYPFTDSSVYFVKFEEGTTYICDWLLRNAKVTKVLLPESLISIGFGAFYSCTLLTEINLSENVSSIGPSAFSLTGLISITLPSKLTCINDTVFSGCKNLSSIVLPENINSIGYQSFYNCRSLIQINCPNKLTHIYSRAFDSCVSLTKLYLHSDIVFIGNDVFKNCPLLTLNVVPGSYAEEYSKSNDIKFAYYLSSVTLNVKIINNSDISGMKLILKDCATNIKNIISITASKNEYSFYGLKSDHSYNLSLLNKYDFCVTEKHSILLNSNITAIEMEAANTCSINVTIFDCSLNDVTSQTVIRWYDENKNYLSQASTLSQLIKGTKLQYEIELNEKLAIEYYNIQPQSLIVNDENDINIYLSPIQKVNISGIIVNEEGLPISNAAIYVSQILDNKYIRNILISSNQDGSFSISIYNFSCQITISQNEYISKTIEINEIDKINFGSIILTEIIGETIDINIYCSMSITDDEEPTTKELLYNSNDLKLNIYDSVTNEEIHDFVFQNKQLVFTNLSYMNSSLLIKASFDSDEFNPITVQTESNISNISITFVQRGSLLIIYEANQNANSIVMIYDEKGKLVNQLDFTLNNVTSSFLNDGEYTVVAMGKSEFFNKIQTFSSLKSSKLVANKDYVVKKAKVEIGKINIVKFDTVPHFDESKFYYTDNKKTIFIPNKISAVEGSYFSFKGHIEFKNEYKENVTNIKVLIEIPDNVEYLSGSLVIDKNPSPFTLNENKMIIPINRNADIFRLCVIPIVKGLYIVNAYIEFDIGNETIFQPIESAKFEAKEMDFFVPENVGNQNIISFGVAPLKSQIYLYCDDILVGETLADKTGEWLIQFDLINPSTFSEHLVYIRINLAEGVDITSKVKSVTYSRNYIEIYQVKLIVNSQVVSIDYLKSNQRIYYSVPTGYSYMTYLVNFTNNNPEIIKNVGLEISTLKDEIIQLPTVYDENKKLWIANHKFWSSDAPTGVEVNYECEESLTISNDDLNESINISDELFDPYLNLTDIHIEMLSNTFSPETGIGKMIHKIECFNEEDNYTEEGFSEISILPISDEEIEEIRQSKDYMKSFDEIGNEYYIKNSVDSEIGYVVVDVKNRTKSTFSISIPFLDDINYDFDFDDESVLLDFKSNFKKVKSWFSEAYKTYKKWKNKYDKYMKEIEKIKKAVCGNLGRLCNIIKLYSKAEKVRKDIVKTINTIEICVTKLTSPDASCIPPEIFHKLFNRVRFYYYSKFTSIVLNLFQKNIWLKIGHKGATFSAYLSLRSFNKLFDENKCSAKKKKFPSNNNIGVTVYVPIIDPSGYVYEAVESNRVKNVTTTIFEKVKKVDIYGDEYEVAEIWNAKDFGQNNPLITDEMGWYAWDVPKGLWQVKYEKMNYETLYSDWLPVPPPQIDVNVPIVSFTQPEIERISGYENRIEIEFTKYMNLDKLNSNNIIITNNDNNTINGKILYINKEVDPNKKELSYASLLHFIPEETFQKDDKIKILIIKNVSSYSGVTMSADYYDLVDINVEPTISIDSEITNISYGDTTELNYKVQITPVESTKGKKLLLKSDSPNIVELKSEFIEIDNNGSFEIPAKILLPGVAHIEMLLEGTAIKTTKTINIDLPKTKLNPVAVSIDTDTCIAINTSVELFSNIEGSTIYFSTNQTINLDSFQPYQGSITITNDILLSAFAQHENYENSEISSFYIRVCYYISITFNASEGTTEIMTKDYVKNEKFGYLPTPIREFYTFNGWYMEPTYETLISSETIVNFVKSTILYAKWLPNIYTISFETNGGTQIKDIKQPHGTVVENSAQSIKEGFKFDGWYEDQELTKKYEFTLMPTNNITLYAKWTEVQSSLFDENEVIKETSSKAISYETISKAINSESSKNNNYEITSIIKEYIDESPSNTKYIITSLSPTKSTTIETTTNVNDNNSSNKKKNIILIGIITGCAVLVILIVVIVLVFVLKRKKIKNVFSDNENDEADTLTLFNLIYNSKNL